MASGQYCRFCEVPVNKIQPKVNNLTAQLLQYHYLDEFYFYFAKPLNEIIGHTRSQEYTAYREMLCQISRPKLDFAYYNKKDCHDYLARRKKRVLETYRPMITEGTTFKFLQKNEVRKKILNNRGREDADERRRFTRRREQLPLRDGNLLTQKDGFVDAESFETKVFDIYNPSFSSIMEIPVTQGTIFTDALEDDRFRLGSSEMFNSRHKTKLKVQIPLLRIEKKVKKPRDECSNGSERDKPRAKLTTDPTPSRGFGNSDNQSTQFSITYNRNNNSRRKQVLEDSKRGGGVVSVTSRPMVKQSSSPKLFKKKKGADCSIKPERKTQKKLRDGESKQKLTSSTSFFNSRSWKLIKSWDKLVLDASKVNGPESSKPKGEKRSKLDTEPIEPPSYRGLQTSHENLKTLPVSGLKFSSRKLALSPRLATERPHNSREVTQGHTYASFKDKISLRENKVCMMKRLHKPLWINIGQTGVQEKQTTTDKGKSRDKTHSQFNEMNRTKSKNRETTVISDTRLLSSNHFLTSRTSRNKGKSQTKLTDRKHQDSTPSLSQQKPKLEWGLTGKSRGYILEELAVLRSSREKGSDGRKKRQRGSKTNPKMSKSSQRLVSNIKD